MKFPWGRIVETFTYDFDGEKVEVVKYLPNKFANGIGIKGQYEEVPLYHISELHQSTYSMVGILLAWIVHRQLGLNQSSLYVGICKALNIKC